jgi:phosphate transport system permease protein
MRIAPATIQRLAKALVWLAALTTLLVLLVILGVVLFRGLPLVNAEFLLGHPRRMGREGGVLPMMVGTLALTAVAVAIATPLGVGTAIYLTEYTRESRITLLIRFGSESLAAVPSIVFGLFGFIFFVIYLNLGWSILSGGLTLAFMILPTIIRTSEEAILAVPRVYRELSYALGATRWQMVATGVLPSALPGIATGIILGIGRSVGETAAIILTAGSALRMPTSLFSPARTMSVHFFILAREGISLDKAYATGAVLIVAVLLVNVVANMMIARFVARR